MILRNFLQPSSYPSKFSNEKILKKGEYLPKGNPSAGPLF